MGDHTEIEWSDSTWNPITGCTKVSPGCRNCYAEGVAHRFAGTKAYPNGFEVTLRRERLTQPLRWTKPRRIFVNSMADLFHDDVPDAYIARVFAVMALAPRHTFQVLTKRHGRMRSLLDDDQFIRAVWNEADELMPTEKQPDTMEWPLPNVWLGVSVENQQWANIRIPALLDTPASVRFLSMEPLLGPVDLHGKLDETGRHRPKLTYWLTGRPHFTTDDVLAVGPKIDWVIAGGESGPKARPMHPDWVRTIRDQCVETGTAFHFKQHGEYIAVIPADGRPGDVWVLGEGIPEPQPWSPQSEGALAHHWSPHGDVLMRRVGKKTAGRELDGQVWDQFPEGRQTWADSSPVR